MTRRTRGRMVRPINTRPTPANGYTDEQVRHACAMAHRYGPQMTSASRSLPTRVRLADGRTLVFTRQWFGGKCYQTPDGMRVIATFEGSPHGLLLHVSCSYADRLPTWDDLKLLRAAFYPDDQDVMQVLPRSDQYVNVHAYTLHLYAMPQAWQGGWSV